MEDHSADTSDNQKTEAQQQPIPPPTAEERDRLAAPLPEDLRAFRATYSEMFGSVPPLPEAKLQFLGRLDPEAARLSEQLRAHAFLSEVLDPKTTQLVLFAMMMATGGTAARHHAVAALRAGATVSELAKVIELASAMVSLGPVNNGSALLAELAGFDPSRPPPHTLLPLLPTWRRDQANTCTCQ